MKTVELQGTIDDGYYSPTQGQTWKVPVIGNAAICTVGSICTGGQKFSCSAGKYCEDIKMSLAAGDQPDCDAGYYCLGDGLEMVVDTKGATNRRPTSESDELGDACKSGQFCTVGVSAGTNCAAGTYSSARGLTVGTECTTCPDGFECPDLGGVVGMIESDLASN